MRCKAIEAEEWIEVRRERDAASYTHAFFVGEPFLIPRGINILQLPRKVLDMALYAVKDRY